MLLKEIKFSKFRNLSLEYKPTDGLNVILGANGKGKSNFLDGLHIVSTGRSFKGFSNLDNISFLEEPEFSRVDVLLESDSTIKLSIIYSLTDQGNAQLKYHINDKATLRNKFTYKLKTILFTPESLELLTGSPDRRRDELDQLISTISKEYEQQVKEYSYIMRSRNKLLYKIFLGRAQRDQLTYWTDRLITVGSAIITSRLQFIKDIRPSIQNTSTKFFSSFPGDQFELRYISKIKTSEGEIRDDFISRLNEEYEKELVLGRTLVGPHRDDLEFSISQRNLHTFGSRGEQRLTTMIFKIAAYEYLTELYKTKVVFLLDDILSELDKDNKSKLVDFISTKSAQVFFSLANKSDLPKSVFNQSRILEL